jgi:hypothetical protein
MKAVGTFQYDTFLPPLLTFFLNLALATGGYRGTPRDQESTVKCGR